MQRAEGIETQEEWKRKVMVKESWVERCLKAGRFLVRGLRSFFGVITGLTVCRERQMTGQGAE